ncbi:MAG: tRNA (adenine(22)-N(1))-methyltransferase [Firmicutes bacterium ADurb.Bin182]|nr:MAG: tRNA (adenine(22)-N(1))-methyltransferase [Firmicutes bacterium ADurb.Bin182]
MIALRPRLEAAASMLAGADCIADIGCDHGRLGIALLQRGLCKRVIASDVSGDSLQKAMQLSQKCGMDGRLLFRLGEGLKVLKPGEADAIAIAGMGGSLITDILIRDELVARAANRIVMQPMRGEEQLRYYLNNNGYRIMDETLIRDAGRFYQLLCASSGEPERKPAGWPDKLYKVGWVTYEKEDPLLSAYIKKLLAGNKRRLETAPDSAGYLREQTVCLEELLTLIEEGEYETS